MKVFTRDYKTNHIQSQVFSQYFGNMKSCVLDIEATGLDPSRCKLVLIGLLTETDSGLRVTQFLAENHYEEHKVLDATLDFLKEEGIQYLITFNGLRYDIPFINTRLENSFNDERISMYDFDLYRFLRKCSKLPDELESLSQASCENYFGISGNRKDTITGRESVALFDEYALTGNSTIEKIILTHNREDVLQLHHLMRIASENDFGNILKTSFHAAIAKYGFPVDNGRLTARPKISGSKKKLFITGDQNLSSISSAYFPDIDNPVMAIFRSTTSSFEVEVPIQSYRDEYYVDITKLGVDVDNSINGYLVLNDRTINILTMKILSRY